MTKSEAHIERQIRLALGSRPGLRLFRQDTGLAWTGRVASTLPNGAPVPQGDVYLRGARRVSYGLHKGSPDLIGWTVRNGVAVFTALECKSATGRPTPEQLRFIEAVQRAGGLAGVVRSVDEALAVLGDRLP